MPLIRAYRLINAIEAGGVTGPQLDTLLADTGRLAEFKAVLRMPGQVRRLYSGDTTLDAISKSTVALAAIFDSRAAYQALLSEPRTFVKLITSSSTKDFILSQTSVVTDFLNSTSIFNEFLETPNALNLYLSSPVFKMAVFNNDNALAEIANSSSSLSLIRANASYTLTSRSADTSVNITGLDNTGSYILTGVSFTAGSSVTLNTINTKRSGSNRPTTATSSVYNNTATAVTMCTPLVTPFNITTNSTGYSCYFGLLRCDV